MAPFAIVLNLAVSIPGAVAALLTGRLNSRVPATLLIAVGGLIPSITSGLNRFGDTSGFFVGELLGVVFIFAGFLVSIEVFSEIRIPFTASCSARAPRGDRLSGEQSRRGDPAARGRPGSRRLRRGRPPAARRRRTGRAGAAPSGGARDA